MKNPCDTCLINSMCGTLCNNKHEYGKYWQTQFDAIYRRQLTTSSGNLRSEKFIKKEILNIKEKIIKRLEANRIEILKIILRHSGTFEQ
jgi:endoglucanase Acf2